MFPSKHICNVSLCTDADKCWSACINNRKAKVIQNMLTLGSFKIWDFYCVQNMIWIFPQIQLLVLLVTPY